jgi:hypothetical protein
MTILIRPIQDSRSVFDLNSRSDCFFYPEAGGWRKMTEIEQKEFSASNFAIGYCGNDIRLSTWSRKESRQLHNLNFMQDAGIPEKRAYLWQLLQTDFEVLSREERRTAGYYALQQYRKIADVLRSGKTVTLWYLSGYDIDTAELFKRFFDYLTRI